MSHAVSDLAEVAPEAALDLGRLEAYLATQAIDLTGPLRLQQFPKGYSNLTYLLRAGGQAFVLRRAPPHVHIKSAHDMGREFRTLQAVAKVFAKVPVPLLYCADPAVIGTPFYLMTRLEGVVLRGEPEAGAALTPEVLRALSREVIDTLAQLHLLDAGQPGLAELGKPDGYLARQVGGWTRRWVEARSFEVPAMETVAAWLAEKQPERAVRPSLLHNDFKYDNLVVDAADLRRVKGVLDWEMAALGDPLTDLGGMLAMWMEASDPPELMTMRLGPTQLPGNLTRVELVERYAKATALPVDEVHYYYALGLFKFAVVAQQLYRRVEAGLTHEPRFARMADAVRGLSEVARRVAQRGRIDGLGD